MTTGTDSLPPRYPWVLGSSKEHPTMQSFYNMEEDRYYFKEVEDISHGSIRATYHEWAVILDYEFTRSFLINLDSMEKIDLPSWDADEGYNFCCLSSSPEDDNCIVAFMDNKRIMYCHPKEKEWSKHEFKEHMGSFTVYKGKIYALNKFDSLMELNFIDDRVELRNVVPGLRHPRVAPLFDDVNRFNSYLAESRENIFLIVISYRGYSGCQVRDIRIYKVDHCNSKWAEVESSGDQTFFVQGDTNSLSWSAAPGTNLMANGIYFVLNGDKSMNVHDGEDQCIIPLLPISDNGSRWAFMPKTMAGLRAQ